MDAEIATEGIQNMVTEKEHEYLYASGNKPKNHTLKNENHKIVYDKKTKNRIELN